MDEILTLVEPSTHPHLNQNPMVRSGEGLLVPTEYVRDTQPPQDGRDSVETSLHEGPTGTRLL